jgi:hypothetical protein
VLSCRHGTPLSVWAEEFAAGNDLDGGVVRGVEHAVVLENWASKRLNILLFHYLSSCIRRSTIRSNRSTVGTHEARNSDRLYRSDGSSVTGVVVIDSVVNPHSLRPLSSLQGGLGRDREAVQNLPIDFGRDVVECSAGRAADQTRLQGEAAYAPLFNEADARGYGGHRVVHVDVFGTRHPPA